MEVSRGSFGVVDYCVFIATLIISFGIGIASSFMGNKSPEEFLIGNRSFGAIPVALSLLTSFISGINFLGFSAEVYAYGMNIAPLMVGGLIGILLSAVMTMPVLYNLKLITLYEYITLRFNSNSLRICTSAMVFLQAIVFMGVCVYAPSLALAAVTPLDFYSYIFIMSSVCTIYSTLGGIRAVIWTDVFQFFIMIVGMVAIIIGAAIQVGFKNIFYIAKEGGRMEFFNTNPSIYERHSMYNTFFSGVFLYMELYGVAQIITQRVCAVPTLKDARTVIGINAVGMLLIHVLIFFGGLAIYATYAGCDPLLEGKIQKKDEILSFFIVDKLYYIPGLAGLFVATMIASTLSTFSSVINAQTAIVWKDFLLNYKIFSQIKPEKAVWINKFITLLLGVVFIGMAILTSKTRSVIQLALTLGGIAFGSIYGVFILGIFVPKSNSKGAWAGLVTSFIFLTWIFCGSMFYMNPPEMLPLSNELCEDDVTTNNSTIYSIDSNSDVFLKIISTKSNIVNATTPQESFSFPLMYLYGISYTLYPIIGPVVCIIVGLVVSYLTGPTKPEDVPAELIIPFLRRFYATKNDPIEDDENYDLQIKI